MSVKDSHAIVDAVQQTLKEHVPSFGEATIHICPAAPSLELKMAM
jgi:divalent metal cation (Fe/Co/Zn/Cd) transporter